ncbi:hypothetical protein [Stenotrophomonas rhizophila]|uniref:hypothetical protein n=1 Tax=Stenotrophomonas rhizophila TaxID=216778 RepID=UPI001E320F39|nr:hypothetical protein [Stenotrophomonas rhizophila]MCC7634781.1 hypothetical protein [Stenotrophomonas rhizophila]MCC7665165.1 hypothetical protein [Stenotrophomonas rhizophila]
MKEKEGRRSRSCLFRTSTDGNFYIFTVARKELNRTLVVLAFWFVWSQRNEIASLLLLIKGLFK